MFLWSDVSGAFNSVGQPVQKDNLTVQNPLARLRNSEPRRAVKFRKLLQPSRSWRPLDFKIIALQICSVPIAFYGPRVDNFSARLLCLAKRDVFAARLVSRLFREFAPCCRKRVFPKCNESLRDRPRSKVFLLPEWSAWMAVKHFYLARCPPEKKKACALFSCGGFGHYHLRSTGQARYLWTFTKRENAGEGWRRLGQ